METKGVFSSRQRNSPSAERFLGVFTQSKPANSNGGSNTAVSMGDELEEDDVFWTGDFSESNHRSTPPPASSSPPLSIRNHFRRPESSGILAVLPEEGVSRTPGDLPVLYRNTLAPSSSSKMIPAIPKPKGREYAMSVPVGKYHHSAPVNVPVKPMRRNAKELEESDDESESEMLPPHEIVEQELKKSEMTFSVLEGVGRTLKGRDLRQVRNAVWRQTGFLD